MAKDIKFNIRLNIDGKQVVVDCKKNVQALGEALTGVKAKARAVDSALSRLTSVSTLMRNGMDGIRQLGAAMQPFIDKANAATAAQTKLTTIMRQRMGATEADTSAINDAVAAQTRLGVVGGTVQKSGLQQLATFASQRQTLETLLPAMNNLLVQQRGLNATSEDAVGVANLMGKALMGNVGALTRVGITLTDHQKELIKTGDEYTKAKTLAEAITDNVGNMNAELAKTDAGQVKKMANSFGSLQVTVGKFFSEYQGVIAGFGQIGMAVAAVGTLGTAFTGLVRAIGLTSAASSLWHARTVMSTAVTNLFSAALNGASVGATTLKFALRGLMSATVVGAAITLLGVGLEKLISYFTSASDASGKLKQSVSDTGQSFEKQRDQALAPTLTKYQELQAEWKSLKSTHEKSAFIKANKTAFEQLGVSIDGVGQAESFFVSDTKAVQDAMYARAEAAAAAAMAEEEMRKALEAESKVNHDRLMDKDSYKKQNHTGKTGQDAALDALVDSGAIKVTSNRTRRDEKELRQRQANARSLLNRSRRATNRANRGLRRYRGGSAAGSGGLRGTGGTGGSRDTRSGSTATEKEALQGSLDWYDQKMQELRKKIYATNNEATAQGLQAQYDDLEQKSKALKVSIGLEQPEQKEVKTYMERLQERLAAAQKQMDNAMTIETRVAASAKVEEIQAEIDKATKGEVSIKADVEPSYIQKGSLADIRQSYQNAQGKASRIQEDFEIGIIGKDEAERQIEEVNKEISKLGKNLKPLKLELDDKSLDAIRKEPRQHGPLQLREHAERPGEHQGHYQLHGQGIRRRGSERGGGRKRDAAARLRFGRGKGGHDSGRAGPDSAQLRGSHDKRGEDRLDLVARLRPHWSGATGKHHSHGEGVCHRRHRGRQLDDGRQDTDKGEQRRDGADEKPTGTALRAGQRREPATGGGGAAKGRGHGRLPRQHDGERGWTAQRQRHGADGREHEGAGKEDREEVFLNETRVRCRLSVPHPFL